MNKKGFTLVELLAVIVILSLIITIVATKGFGVLENSKKKIEEEQIKMVEDSVKIVMLDVAYCKDSTKDYEDLVDYFEIDETINSCDKLKEELDSTSSESTKVNLLSFKDNKIINDSDYEKIKHIDFYVEYNKETNETNVSYVTKDLEIEKNISDKTLCGSTSFGNDKLYYGDINLDGRITEVDADIVVNFGAGLVNLSSIQEILADVNKDGLFNSQDALIIKQHISGSGSGIVGTEYEIKATKICADVNNDGKLNSEDYNYLKKYLDKEEAVYLTNYEKRQADIDGNGVLNSNDLNNLKRHILDNISVTQCNSPLPNQKILYGDVDLSGEITEADGDLLLKIAAKPVEFNDIQKKLADVNQDGYFNSTDSLIVKQYAAGIDKSGLVGNEYLSEKLLYGDVNLDGEITDVDADLVAKAVVQNIEFADLQKKLADFDNNNKITIDDVVTIQQYIAGKDSSSSLVGKEYLFGEDKFIYGDVDLSGEITEADGDLLLKIAAKPVGFNDIQKKLADVNQDGYFNSTDSLIVKQYAAGIDKSGLVGSELKTTNICGDINNDGKIDSNDVNFLEKYISDSNNVKINGYQKGLVDFNKDLIVDNLDLSVLKKYVKNN